MSILRRYCIGLVIVLGLCPPTASAQRGLPGSFSIGTAAGVSVPSIPSNSVSHISIGGDRSLWIGSGKGLARTNGSGLSWESFRSDPAFASDGIFAVGVRGDTIWSSTGYDKAVDGGTVQTGTGYALSTNNGVSWTHLPQVIDARGDSIVDYGINDSLWVLPIVVSEQNVTFDVSFNAAGVWVASWASGLRRSTDLGATWQRIILPTDSRNSISPADTLWSYLPSDTLQVDRIYERFDPRNNNNFLAFSVLAVDENTIWCGTAGGVNLSTDGGLSWSKFTHTNQAAPILGNWVIAVERQVFESSTGDTVRRIWTTNWQAAGRDEQFGVSYSDDNGQSWTNLLHGVRAYDFAFRDSIAYIATNQGIFRTADGGLTFNQVSEIIDDDGRTQVTSGSFYSAGSLDDSVFVGTADGLARTVDNEASPFGSSWKVYRAYQPVGASGTSYAYPNPFSPLTEPTRIHYATPSGSGGGNASVRIEIYDFGMNRIRTLLNQASRPAGTELDELWDGSNDAGSTVANGVYFYRIDVGSDEPLFGKIVVMQ
jgi:photosystem II stability/assembly factor-like uncharacterized protein